jgi:hypothetical protein
VGRTFPEILSGGFDHPSPGLELGFLDLDWVVRAQRVEHGLAVGVGLLR